MDSKTRELIQKANSICQSHGKPGPGNRYPLELKVIISDLINEYGLSVLQVTRQIPISGFSAREWSRKNKNKFRKISVKDKSQLSSQKKKEKHVPQFTWVSMQILLLALQLFLHSID